MNDSIKQEVHQLVDKCENEMLLEKAKVLLQTENKADLWDELTEEDKNLVMESEAQYGKGIFISHQELIRLYQQWKNNAELTPGQKLALDKELEVVKNNPDYLLKWNDIKSRFKKS